MNLQWKPGYIIPTILLIIIVGCREEVPDSRLPIDISLEWEESTLTEVGIENLDQAVNDASQIPRFRSLLVVKDGFLVLEEYFNGFSSSDLADVRSVTKSIISSLVGIAIDQGYISDIDQTIDNFLPSNEFTLSDTHKSITIRHLLEMSSGMEWDEWTGSSYNDWIVSNDHVNYILQLPFSSSPGEVFVYNSGAVHLLGVVVEKAVGMKLTDFADQFLFGRVGISNRQWEELSDNYVNGGAGIDLRPRDLARFGQLFLQEGISGDEQILSSSWTFNSTGPKYSWTASDRLQMDYTYAHLWWDLPNGFLAWGYGGQFIYVIPSENLVIVTTTEWRQLSQDIGAAALEEAVMTIIREEIVPQVK